MFYLHYFSIGALYQPMLSTFTVLGQGPHYIARLENDRRSVLKHLLKNQLIGEVGNQIIDIPRPPGRVRKAEHRS